MKQTAVGFLKKHIENDAIALYDGFMTFTEFMDKLDGYYNKAKKMEKEQIIDARVNGVIRGIDICDFPTKESLHEEHLKYYNEVFNKGQ